MRFCWAVQRRVLSVFPLAVLLHLRGWNCGYLVWVNGNLVPKVCMHVGAAIELSMHD